MTSLKTRILALLSAALVMFTMSSTSMASWDQPSSSDVHYAVANISAQATKLLQVEDIEVSKIKVVNIEDVLTGDQLVNVKNTLNKLTVQLEILTLRGVLNGLKILNGAEILNIGDVLSDNDVTLDDVVAVYLFPDSKLLIFSCPSC